MILEWILFAWLLKKLCDWFFMREMTQDEYDRLAGHKKEVKKWRSI